MKIRFKMIFIVVICFVVVNFLVIAQVKATDRRDELRQRLLEEDWEVEDIEAIMGDLTDEEIESYLDSTNNDDDVYDENYDDENDDDADYNDDENDDEDYYIDNDADYDDNNQEYDATESQDELAYTGFNNYYLLFIFTVGLITFLFIQYRKYKDIK